MDNYLIYHLHTELSLLDSCTNYKLYIDKAKELGMTSLCFSEHGNVYNWLEKKQYCEKNGLKYIHGCEVYLTEKLWWEEEQINKKTGEVEIKKVHKRDNYHTVLIAKNLDGFKELNKLIYKSTDEEHMYYKPRITFDDFFNLSDNIISTSACLQSPLNKLPHNKDNILNNISILENNKQKELIYTKENIEKIFKQYKLNYKEGYDTPYSSKEEYLNYLIQNINKKYDEKIKRLKDDIGRINNDNLNELYEKLIQKYTFLEIQPHYMSEEQVKYNKYIIELSKKHNKPLIVGTDTHSLNSYKSECRALLKKRKNMSYDNEDDFDLTMKSYDEILDMFSNMDVDINVIKEALNNTNKIETLTEKLILDTSFKYPNLYKDEEKMFIEETKKGLEEKERIGALKANKQVYIDRINEEFIPYKKTGMFSFMLFMSELIKWCHANGIPTSPSRGSCSGSEIAYLLGITDLDAIEWNTIFSRFVNEYRVSLGDIDIDFPPDSREKVYKYIIDRFGEDKTCYILTTNTIADKGTIDDIVGGLYDNPKDKDSKQKCIALAKEIKQYYEENGLEASKNKYPKVFYYFEGLRGTVVSQGIHPAGIVASPITLSDNIGLHCYDGKVVSQINMDEIHDLNYVKYDILGLKNVAVIRDTCKFTKQEYPQSYKVDWNDENVWNDIISSPYAIFQFEGNFAYDLLKKYKPKKINDLSLINASLRPSGASYRNDLIDGKQHKNLIPELDELLKDNKGYLVFQEDVSKFLIDICGFNGGEADNLRRAIAGKNLNMIQENIPKMLEGYMKFSNKQKEQAEKELKEVIDVLIDASSYMFGYNHSTGYSMLGYLCGYYRYYYPLEFICAILNNADNMEDVVSGTELAKLKKIKIHSPKFGYSAGKYMPSKETNSIYKGIGSIKGLNETIGDELYKISNVKYDNFLLLLENIVNLTSCSSAHIETLIKLNFFSDYGKSKKLLYIYRLFAKFSKKDKLKMCAYKQQFKKESLDEDTINLLRKYSQTETDKNISKVDTYSMLIDLINLTPNESFSFKDTLLDELQYLGYIDYTNQKLNKRYVLITEVNTKYTPIVNTYCLNNGATCKCKINKKLWNNNGGVKENDIIYIHSMEKKFGWRKIGEITDKKGNVKPKFEVDESKHEWWITDYSIIPNIEEVLDEF